MGGGPGEPQGGSSTLQGHGLWRTATLMSPPLTHPQPVRGLRAPGAPAGTSQASAAASGLPLL